MTSVLSSPDFYIAITTQWGDLWVVGGHQGGDGGSCLAPYDHRVGFVCMRGAPTLVDPDNPGPPFCSLGAPPIHTKPTQWPYWAIRGLISPTWCPPIAHITTGLVLYVWGVPKAPNLNSDKRGVFRCPQYIQNQPGGSLVLKGGAYACMDG